MLSGKTILKEQASGLFAEALAQTVSNQIEEDSKRIVGHISSPINPDQMTPYSLATGFLADRFYSTLGVGEYSGQLHLSWNGMDEFIYVPDPAKPFTYTTSEDRVIAPRKMVTDGGSIPHLLRGLAKFSSWGYAPAFIVHDWLFTAKKCRYQPDVDWTLPKSALVMAEAIKTLMEVGIHTPDDKFVKLEKAEDTLYLMYLAVNSSIAKDLWEDDGSASCIT